MEMTERAATTLGAKAEVDKVVAEGRSAPPTMKRRSRLMQQSHAPCWRDGGVTCRPGGVVVSGRVKERKWPVSPVFLA